MKNEIYSTLLICLTGFGSGYLFHEAITSQKPQVLPPVEIVVPVSIEDMPYDSDFNTTCDYFKMRESLGYSEEELKEPGKAGELGLYQVTPIYCKDHLQRTGERLDPFNEDQCRESIKLYLQHYGPSRGIKTIGDAYLMYQWGPTGYYKAKERAVD